MHTLQLLTALSLIVSSSVSFGAVLGNLAGPGRLQCQSLSSSTPKYLYFTDPAEPGLVFSVGTEWVLNYYYDVISALRQDGFIFQASPGRFDKSKICGWFVLHDVTADLVHRGKITYRDMSTNDTTMYKLPSAGAVRRINTILLSVYPSLEILYICTFSFMLGFMLLGLSWWYILTKRDQERMAAENKAAGIEGVELDTFVGEKDNGTASTGACLVPRPDSSSIYSQSGYPLLPRYEAGSRATPTSPSHGFHVASREIPLLSESEVIVWDGSFVSSTGGPVIALNQKEWELVS
ncbi:hypothetical protein GQ43DRAFT_430592 [Delitschia confertaspora ATCC 74209]|uniref:Uncharacterized protein n=1 Tax=Delitschia confertaspora ATCC 74209 TaxID=1513339 RepID=A0A9P4MR73_9PLEO|nr:hypothetical protein GQ43DRAFT_430592 [Delitschia confertaspora ATCC 74209]